jgi:hypothetical protein
MLSFNQNLSRNPSLATFDPTSRRPVAVGNTRLSVSNFDQVLRIPTALGLPPSAAAALNQAVGMLPPPPELPGWGPGWGWGDPRKALLSAGLALGGGLYKLNAVDP